jgi:hypothetical protein
MLSRGPAKRGECPETPDGGGLPVHPPETSQCPNRASYANAKRLLSMQGQIFGTHTLYLSSEFGDSCCHAYRGYSEMRACCVEVAKTASRSCRPMPPHPE